MMMHSVQEYFCSVSEDSTKGQFLHQELKKKKKKAKNPLKEYNYI